MDRPAERTGEEDLVHDRDDVEREDPGSRGTHPGETTLPGELPHEQPRPGDPDADPAGGSRGTRPPGDPGQPVPQRAHEDAAVPPSGARGPAEEGLQDAVDPDGPDVPAPNPEPATGDPEPRDAGSPLTPGEGKAGGPQPSPGAPTPQPPGR